jgi:hypothetical protein
VGDGDALPDFQIHAVDDVHNVAPYHNQHSSTAVSHIRITLRPIASFAYAQNYFDG